MRTPDWIRSGLTNLAFRPRTVKTSALHVRPSTICAIRRSVKHRILKIAALALCAIGSICGPGRCLVRKRITVKKLPNGLTLLICERPEAPVFAFFTMVDAGSAQDPLGETGLAHMFEHMAFKGTDKIGTTNYAAEKVALQKWKRPTPLIFRERDKRVGRDEAKLAQLEKGWKTRLRRLTNTSSLTNSAS